MVCGGGIVLDDKAWMAYIQFIIIINTPGVSWKEIKKKVYM